MRAVGSAGLASRVTPDRLPLRTADPSLTQQVCSAPSRPRCRCVCDLEYIHTTMWQYARGRGGARAALWGVSGFSS